MSKVLQKSIWRGRIYRYAPLFLWIGVILFASTAQGATQNTSRFVLPLLHFLFPHSPEETLIIYHAHVRKLAHLTEYGILALWAARAFSNSAVNILRKFWFIFAFAVVFLVASIDEYNQSFDYLRTSSIYDVLLDSIGGVLMIIFFSICLRIRRKNL